MAYYSYFDWNEGKRSLAMTYSPTLEGSTIGVGGLNFRVRNGNGCGPSTIITRQYTQKELRVRETPKVFHV